ncbi:MAG: DUF1146 domain-containing protein [Mollicutes bacterium]|nr:DUF1146 domain-containing protein [Mollicutes bacterium]
MAIKAILYIIVTPLVIWALDGVNINSIFKKNKILQASILYIMICISLTYLVVNFFMDFFIQTRIM